MNNQFDIQQFLSLEGYEETRKDRRKGSSAMNEFFTPYSIVKRMCDKVSDEDILKENNGKKFDVVLMNPPYGKNLPLEFLTKVSKISNNVVSVQPSVWLNKQGIAKKLVKYREQLNGKVTNIEIIDHNEANKIFNTGNSIETLGIFTLSENGTPIDLYNFGFESKEEKQLYEKISKIESDNDKFLTFSKCMWNHNWGWENSKRTPLHLEDHKYYVPVYTWHGGENCYDAVIVQKEKKKISFILLFKSEEETINFKNSLKTKFMNWYYWNFIVPGDCKLTNFMFRLKDYSKPITDETFYKLFDLNDKEIEIIENFKHE